MGSGHITKYPIILDLIEIIQFCLNIYDLLDILDIFVDSLLYFHNGRCSYSISVDTSKTRDPNFWEGSVILNFSVWLIIKKWQPFFNFFHNGWCWYFINTAKTRDVNFLFVQFSKFSVGSVFPVTHPRFCYNINMRLCLKHFCIVTFLHSENQRHKFSLDSVIWTFLLVQFSHHPSWFRYNIYVSLCIKHLCMVTFLH